MPVLEAPRPDPDPIALRPASPRTMLRTAQLCELLAAEWRRDDRHAEAAGLEGEAAALRCVAVGN